MPNTVLWSFVKILQLLIVLIFIALSVFTDMGIYYMHIFNLIVDFILQNFTANMIRVFSYDWFYFVILFIVFSCCKTPHKPQ